jgi:hypothetical protein
MSLTGDSPLTTESIAFREPAVEQEAMRLPNLYRLAGLFVGVLVGIGAQFAIAQGLTLPGVLGYVAAIALVVLCVPAAHGIVRTEQGPVDYGSAAERLVLVGMALLSSGLTFWLSAGNRYTVASVLMWLVSIACWWAAFARMTPGTWGIGPLLDRLRARLTLNRTARVVLMLLAGILVIGLAFRFVNLSENPLDMNSDQAEKLLDVNDVLNGTPFIFFERNTGREPWQFYWTVMLIRLFNLPTDFMALKIGTSLIGWLMLPAVFLLAREVLGTRVALLATLFAAVASWGVIPARFGLRYPLAPCATAWTLFFLVRGLRRDERNSLLAAGIAMGIGLQGYTAYRLMPLVCLLIVVFWAGWLYVQKRKEQAVRSLVGTGMALVLAVAVCMPLIRYGVDNPDALLYRVTTRVTGLEQPVQGAAGDILLDNLKNVLLMFNFTYDHVWVANIPEEPAMDPLLGALLVAGAAACVVASVRGRDPWPAVVLAAGLFMLLPSALNLAFPRENPSVVRTGGALPMLMIVCAVIPGMLLDMARRNGWVVARVAAPLVVLTLSAAIVAVNSHRVFAWYPAEYCVRVQNASDIAQEIRAFYEAGNPRSNAWLVSYPHWVDHRAVGVWLGDIAFSNVAEEHGVQVDLRGEPGLFVLNAADEVSLRALREKYPEGQTRTVQGSQCSSREFVAFAVP